VPTFEFLYADVRMMADAPDEDTARSMVEADLDGVALEFRYVKTFN
jgi:hypothetical protein